MYSEGVVMLESSSVPDFRLLRYDDSKSIVESPDLSEWAQGHPNREELLLIIL